MKRSRESDQDSESDLSPPDAHRDQQSDHGPRHVSKITELDAAIFVDGDEDVPGIAMRCFLPPHKEPLTFNSYDEYDAHYQSFHTNRCLECRKNFPSEHLLGVHIEEWHDPLMVIKRDRREHTVSTVVPRARFRSSLTHHKYSCFVEGCERKCMTHQKRRMHLIDKHMFPKNYFFGITKDGIDGRRSLLVDGGHHRRRSSASAQTKETRRRASLMGDQGPGKATDTETSPESESVALCNKSSDATSRPDTDMAGLTGAMSALNFVPPSVRFGKGRAGFPKR